MHGTRKRRPPVGHYLLTLPHAHLHAYLMVDDARYVADTAERLAAEAERLGFNRQLLTVMLATPLEDAGVVRGIVASHSAEAARQLSEAVDYHLTIFSTCEADPADRLLMAMH